MTLTVGSAVQTETRVAVFLSDTMFAALLIAPRVAAGMSMGGGDFGFGQTCDAVTICPERARDGVMLPSVRRAALLEFSRTVTRLA